MWCALCHLHCAMQRVHYHGHRLTIPFLPHPRRLGCTMCVVRRCLFSCTLNASDAQCVSFDDAFSPAPSTPRMHNACRSTMPFLPHPRRLGFTMRVVRRCLFSRTLDTLDSQCVSFNDALSLAPLTPHLVLVLD
jgi:hypothetical protein